MSETNKQKIQSASWRQWVYFKYKKKTGEIEEYKAEVYDVHDDRFFGFDLDANKLKSFMFVNVMDVEIGEDFVPRWEKKNA